MRTVLATVMLGAAACGPGPGTDGGSSGLEASTAAESSGTSSTPTSSTTAPTSGTTGGSMSGGGTSEGGSTGGSSGGTTGGDPESVCDPQPEPVTAEFIVDGETFPQSGGFDQRCTVDGIGESQQVFVALSGCKTDLNDPGEPAIEHSLEFEVSPGGPIDLTIGESVRLTYFVDAPWWSNEFVALRRETGALVVAGLIGANLPGGPDGPAAEFFAPLQLSRVEVCPPETVDNDTECGGFICDPVCGEGCTLNQREALRVTWDDTSVDIIDRSAQQWPDQPYWAVVATAVNHVEICCTDTPDRWHRWMFVRVVP